MKDKLYFGTSASSANDQTLDIKKMLRIMEEIGPPPKKPVLAFSPMLKDSCLKGEFIDKMLKCSEHEFGLLLPIEHKHVVGKMAAEFKPIFNERPFRMFDFELPKKPVHVPWYTRLWRWLI